MRVISNIDLDAGAFPEIAKEYARLVPVEADFRFEHLKYVSLLDSDISIELVCFFQRRCYVTADAAGPAVAALDRVFDTVLRAGGINKIRRMVLIDCGDPLMAPMTDLSVLNQYVECARDHLPIDTDLHIHAAEIAWSSTTQTSLVVRDTRSESFITLMTEHLRQSMEILSHGLGTDRPEFDKDLSRSQVNRRLQRLLPVSSGFSYLAC